eukprot:gene14729-4362_t
MFELPWSPNILGPGRLPECKTEGPERLFKQRFFHGMKTFVLSLQEKQSYTS